MAADGVDRQELALLLRRLTLELDAVGERFAGRHGLGRTDVRALVAITDAARSGAALTAGALGAAVDPSSASVTALVDRLERAGHVRRIRDSEDRRRVSLEMSDSAMAAGAAYFGGLQRDLVGAMQGYSPSSVGSCTTWPTWSRGTPAKRDHCAHSHRIRRG